MNRIRKFVGFLLFAALPSFAFAGTTEFRVLFDTDDDATTGCTVGGLEGVEQVLVTQISDDDSAPRVTRTHRQLCSNNALATPIDIVTSPWPATWRASDRQLTVETRIPFTAFGSNATPSGIHVAFDATRNASVHSALANADGTPAILPETARMRATGVPPRVMVLDGVLSDWGMISPILFGIQDGGSTALRIVRILTHASQHDNFLYFAAELRIASGSPFADEDTYSREQGSGVTINAPGVLANDGDPLGRPLTTLKVSEPEKGTVTLNPDGSFTYTPNNPHSLGTDQFEYKATTGDEQSNVARVRIKVGTGESPDQSPVDDEYSTEEDETLNVPAPGVLANDPPPLGTAGTAALVTPPSHGTVVLNANGGFVYKPAKNYFGTDTFVYSVSVGNSPLGGNATVTITIEPVNDPPTFTPGGNVSVPANSGPYSQQWATNISPGPANESNQGVNFIVTNDNNTLFSTQPAISPNGTLTFTPSGTALGTATVSVKLRDTGGVANGGDNESATVTFTITITCGTITVTNPATTTGTAGTPFSQTFTRSGSIGAVTFTTSSTLPAGLTLAPNGVLSGTPTQTGSFPIVVTVTDSQGCTGTGPTYPLVIGCPTITVTNPATSTGTVGTPFSQNFTQSGAVGAATFTTSSTLPAGLTLAANGTLSGTPSQFGTFPIVVTVTDSNGCTGTSATYTLVISCQTITVTNPANANGTAGSAFSETFTQTGGIGATTFTLASGTLPAGLTLAANGTLSGTPTQTGSFPITVTATDSNGCTGTSPTYTLVIGCQTITVTNPANGNGTAASAFSETFTQTGAIGTATFTLASGTWPAGLTLAANGTLSGVPTQTGSFPITVTATDSNGCTGTGTTYTVTIGCQIITVTSSDSPAGTAGGSFNMTFTQTGGIPPVTFTLASGTLPAGLTLAPNGVLSGTPTQTGSFPITVAATDVNGCTGSGTVTLVIGCQTITVTNPANANGTVGTGFSETFTQTGSIGGATFTLASGVLPAGLTLAPNGVLSGTPTQSGSFPITVTVTDGNGCTGTSATYNLVIACQTITVTNPANATGPAGSPFSETFTQTGAVLPATFTLASGTLPTGLTLAPNGVLSGTPTQGGTFPITVLVTDSNGCTGTSAPYNLAITCPVITVNNPANGNGTANSPFSETFTSSGGIGTMTYTLASGTLPAGLTLAANGILSGTPTQTGSFPITVTATDQNGCPGTGTTYTINIVCQTITVSTSDSPSGLGNSPFSMQFTQTGAIGTATFTLASGALPAGLTLSTSGLLSGTPTQTGSFPITVMVTDSNGCTGTSGTVNLVFACQTITVNNPANGNGTANSPFSETFTHTNGIEPVTYSLASGVLPAGLTLATNGVLSGTPTQTGSFPITVTATDANGCTGTGGTYTIVIGCQTITVTNPANANGTAGSAFSETFTQTGAIGSATFTLASGTLPAGLTLAANGVVAGTPTQTGSFPITVTVTDSNGCTGTSATYTIVIGCPTITVINPSNATGPAGSPFSETFTNTGAIGAVTYTLASGTLPAGLTLAPNGVLSGTPTQGGSFPITVTVTDSNGCTDTGDPYTVVITCPTITVNNPANANGTAGSAFSETFTQTGGQVPITYTLASGTLPAGLTLAANGTLSGTPTQTGSFPITVTATDANGCTGTGTTYTIVIGCQTITVTNPANGNGTAGSAFSETFTQTGAIGTTTFTLASGTLPAGLTLAANGVLSGTPTQTGSFPITVTATDANGCTGTGSTYTIVIGCQVITVNNPANTSGTLGAAFNETFTQTGAIGSATFTTASTLPAGLTLATNGTLSGTPTQPGTFPIVVTVTDGNGCTGNSATYTLVIACQTITVNNPANANGTVGSVFSETFTESGSIGTPTFTTASTLPAGLTLAANGVLSGTPTQAGNFPIVVTVTDSNGCTGSSATYNLVIVCQTITVNNPANANGTVGSAFSETFTQTGAIGTTTFTLASGTLPTGLTLASNGVLSGTPTQAGSFPITVTATDSNGCTGTSATYTIVIVCQVITVNNPATTTGTVDAAFSQTFTNTGAIGAVTYTLASGTLPSGLTLAANGTLSGTPGQPGSFPITVTVTDANGCTGTSATYTLVIACQVITVTNPATTTATYNAAFSQTFTQTGVGTHGPAVFTTSSTLPTGLTLATNGTLSGTPTQTGTFPIVVTVTDVNGCTGTGATYTLAVAPVAVGDSYNNAVNNTQFVLTGGATATPSTPSVQVAGSISSNDQPAGNVSVVPGTFATTNGGSVTIAADGTYLYTPPAQPGLVPPATDTFTYTVTSNTGGTGPVTSAPATVTINLTNRVWYVKNDSAAGGNGRSHSPFDTLAEAQTASTANDIIYVYFGNGTNSGQNSGIVLKNNQKLYGQGIALVVNSQTLVIAGSQPLIGNSGGHGVTVTNLAGIDIRGLNITASVTGIEVTTSGVSGGDINISDNTIRGNGGQGVHISPSGTGTYSASVHDNILSGSASAMAVTRQATGGPTFITAFDDNIVPGTSNSGINITGVGGVVTFDAVPGGGIDPVAGGITTFGNPGDRTGTGLALANVIGTLNYTDLDAYTDAGHGLNVDGGVGGFTFTVAANVSTMDAIGGAAVTLTDVTSLTLQLASMTSTNSTANGVLLSNVTGTFSAPVGSSITNAANADFQISASNVDVTYAGTITDDQGQLISISSNTGTRTHAFTGAITDGDDGDGSGITMSGNSAGTTVRFSGGVVLSTGSAAALSASGGGVLEICDESACNAGATGALINKITTTTGTALNVSSTNIGAGDLEFRSISVTGNGTLPASGIILNATGSTGNLNVRGNGGSCSSAATCTGGAIQSTGSHGISLTNTTSPTFVRMFINSTGGSGVNGTTTTNFTFTDGVISNSGTAGGVDDSNISFNDSTANANVSGTITITNNSLTNSRYHGIDIQHYTGTITHADIQNNTLTSQASIATSLGSAIRLDAYGTAATVGHVMRATINNNVITNFPTGAGFHMFGGNDSGTGPAGTFGVPGNATNVIAITNNRMDGGALGIGNQPDRFFTGGVNGNGQGNFDISGNGTAVNPITRIDGVVIELNQFGTGSMTGRVNNNFIQAFNAVGSVGINVGCDADATAAADNAAVTYEVSGNNVSQTDGNGIFAIARGSQCSMVAKVLSNTVAAPATTAAARPGIRVHSGSAGSANTVCLEMSGNTTAGSTNTGTGSKAPGIELRRNLGADTFNIEGLPGTPAGTPAVENYINSINTSASGTFGVGGTILQGTTTGYGSCTAP